MSSVSSNIDGGYSYISQNVNDIESDADKETQKSKDGYSNRAKELENSYQKALSKKEEEFEQTIQNYRNRTAEENEQAHAYAKAQVDKLRQQNYDRFGKTRAEMETNNKRMQEAINQAQVQLAHDRQNVVTQQDNTSEKINAANAQRMLDIANSERFSRDRESSQLRAEIADLQQSQAQYMKNRAIGDEESRRALEEDFRAKENNIVRSNALEMAATKQRGAQAERYLTNQMDQDRKDREMYYAGAMEKLNQDHYTDKKQLYNNDQRVIHQTQDLAKRTAELGEQALEKQSEQMNADREEALNTQAKTFSDEKLRLKTEDNQKIKLLQNHIHESETSPDPSYISPAAEESLRRTYLESYGKEQEAETARNKGKTDSLQQEYATRLTKNVVDSQTKLAHADMQHEADNHLQTQVFLGEVSEMEKEKQLALRKKDNENTRHEQTLNRTMTTSLDRQRREYESLLDSQKIDSDTKTTELRQQAEFDSKLAQRNFALQHAEQSHAYEKKMDEQKNMYEDAIAALKEQLAQGTRDSDRRTKQLLDDQQRGYEQKIALLEFQSKEKERTISQNYETEIDKLRRANALISQRKSEKS